MAIPQTFTTSAPAIASYNYQDIADGTGIATFYGLVYRESTADGGAKVPYLSTSSEYGSEDFLSKENDGITFNFDLTPFNTPRTAKGTATISFRGRQSAGSSVKFTARLIHVDGITAATTNISSTQTTINVVGDTSFVLPLELTTKHFKKGDILRLYMTQSNVSGTGIYINSTYPIKLLVPFEIEV